MGSIHHELSLDIDAADAWRALRQVGEAHRLFAGVLIDGRIDGDVRTVTFADGMKVREKIIDVNDERRRIAYSVFDGTPMTQHNAAMQILGEGRPSRFAWTADFLPDEFGAAMLPLVRQGAQALKRNLESGAFRVEPDSN